MSNGAGKQVQIEPENDDWRDKKEKDKGDDDVVINTTKDISFSAPGYNEYVDVSSYYEEPVFPKMYAKPADPVMPNILKKYLINEATPGPKYEASDIADMQHYGEYQREMDNPATQAEWRQVRSQYDYVGAGEEAVKWSSNVLKVLDLDPNDEKSYTTLDYWRQIAQVKNVKSKNDSDAIIRTINKYNGVLPDVPPKKIFN